MKRAHIIAAAAVIAPLTLAAPAQAQSEPYIGQVIIVPYSFCPRGTAEMDGKLLAISANQALFSLLGTVYGGDGRTTFALPDMRGRTAVGVGSGPGLTEATIGTRFGAEIATLRTSNLPSHTHSLTQSVAPANTAPVDGASSPGVAGQGPATATQSGAVGGGQPFSIQQPSLVLRHCIALNGVFPSRN